MLDILTWFFCARRFKYCQRLPQIRRRFIDMELGQISAVYLNDLAQYQRILKQKNNYLKQLQLGQKQDTTMLEVLNQQFAQYALNVTLRRAFHQRIRIIG